MMTGPSICHSCANVLPDGTERLTCQAYPDGIPNEILFGGYDHRTPFEGDGGVRFVLNPAKKAKLDNYLSTKSTT